MSLRQNLENQDRLRFKGDHGLVCHWVEWYSNTLWLDIKFLICWVQEILGQEILEHNCGGIHPVPSSPSLTESPRDAPTPPPATTVRRPSADTTTTVPVRAQLRRDEKGTRSLHTPSREARGMQFHAVRPGRQPDRTLGNSAVDLALPQVLHF